MINFIKPILILSVVSSTFSLLISNNFFSFTKYFVAITIIQILLYNLYKTYLKLHSEKIQNERIKEFSKQGLETTCPCYQNKKVFIPIRLDSDNSYKCLDCDKNVSVKLDVKTFLTTDVIDLDKSEKEFIEAIKKIKESV